MRQLEETIHSLDRLVYKNSLKGYDPYDILNCPSLLWVAERNRLAGVALTQAFRFLPINLRPVLGVPKLFNAKTMALLARAFFKLYTSSQDDTYLNKARSCLDWLDAHRSPGCGNACWGYSFPWCTIRQFLERDAPSIVCTSFVAHAFLDAYELQEEEHDLVVARSACEFILNDCPRITGSGSYCFSYTPFGELPVHNANLLGVSVLGRVYRYTEEHRLIEAALPALKYTLNDQNADGSWFYHGPYTGRDGTIDNFHTGFVLECLRRLQTYTGYNTNDALERGQLFYEQRFFDPDGTPWRKLGHQFPVDIRDVAQLLVVMGQLEKMNHSQQQLLDRVINWAWNAMHHPSGYFYFMRWRAWGYSPLYLRWQAWMLWGIANVLAIYEEDKE